MSHDNNREVIIAITALADNYIWMLINQASKQAWVVDPGEAKPVISALNHHRLILAGILLTHHHYDHSAGIPELLHYAGDIPVIASHKSPHSFITHAAKENDIVHCTSFTFTAMEIPGHTLDHIAYYGNSSVFCGDTLFSAGCGRVFEGTHEMMYHTLEKLLLLPGETKIYCGHEYTLKNLLFAQQVEPKNMNISNKIIDVKKIIQQKGCSLPSTLSAEKTYNPFLRCTHPDVVAAAEKYAGKKLNNPAEVFSCIREWKNHF